MRAFILLCAFLLPLACPARAADNVAAAQSVIRSQVEFQNMARELSVADPIRPAR